MMMRSVASRVTRWLRFAILSACIAAAIGLSALWVQSYFGVASCSIYRRVDAFPPDLTVQEKAFRRRGISYSAHDGIMRLSHGTQLSYYDKHVRIIFSDVEHMGLGIKMSFNDAKGTSLFGPTSAIGPKWLGIYASTFQLPRMPSDSRFNSVSTSHNIGFRFIYPILLLLIYPAWFLYRRATAKQPGDCASCGYDLRASTERCPECGTKIQTPQKTQVQE